MDSHDKISRVVVDLWDKYLHQNRVLLIVSLNEVDQVVEGIWQPSRGLDYPKVLTGAGIVRLGYASQYFLTAVTLHEPYSCRRVSLTTKGEAEAWSRIKNAFRWAQRSSNQNQTSLDRTPAPQEEGVVWVGQHKTYHPAITELVRDYADPYNAVLILSGDEIDRAITQAYEAKREPPSPPGEEVS